MDLQGPWMTGENAPAAALERSTASWWLAGTAHAALWRVSLTALAALLYVLAFPPFGLRGLAWIALVPFALALEGAGRRAAAGLAAVLGWGVTVGIIAWLVPTLHGHFERSLAFSIGFLALFALTALPPFLALAFALHADLADRLPRSARPLLFATVWVAAEWLRTQLGFRSPWALLGESQVEAERLRQLASLLGVFGLSGLVALANATLAELVATGAALLRARATSSEARRALVASSTAATLLVLALGAAWLYGGARLSAVARARAAHPPLRVALVQGHVRQDLRWRRSLASRVLRRYGGMTRDLLLREPGPAPDLVIWPENALQAPPDDPHLGGPLLRMVERRGVPLLLGAPRHERFGAGVRVFNSAWLLRPGARPETYDKRRLLAFSESRPLGALAALGTRGDLDPDAFTPGSQAGVFELGRERLGVLICMEALYPALAREALTEGASVLVNLSNDAWYAEHGGAHQHFEQVVFRAIETGLPLVRATSTGVSAVVAPDGRVIDALALGERAVLRAELPPATAPPLYARTGDAFAIACLLALSGTFLPRFLARPRGVVPGADVPSDG